MAREIEVVEGTIMAKLHLIPRQKAMTDRDLSELYGVETHGLKEQVNAS